MFKDTGTGSGGKAKIYIIFEDEFENAAILILPIYFKGII